MSRSCFSGNCAKERSFRYESVLLYRMRSGAGNNRSGVLHGFAQWSKFKRCRRLGFPRVNPNAAWKIHGETGWWPQNYYLPVYPDDYMMSDSKRQKICANIGVCSIGTP